MDWEEPEFVLGYFADGEGSEVSDLHRFLLVEMDAVVGTGDCVDGGSVEDLGGFGI